MTLPPGQYPIDGFPRFGTHLHRPPPAVPVDPVIEISGAVRKSFALPLAELATLPRRELTADFHCVTGWSATDLHWEGVAFETFYRMIIEPSVPPDTSVTHVVFGGLDGYRSVMSIEDALAEDVLVADRLDGRPLDGDHGAPARLVSPNLVSTKHLCRIELHTAELSENYHSSPIIDLGLHLIKPHPRARVWEEERHRYLPAWSVRRVYRLLIPVIAFLCSRGSRPLENHDVTGHQVTAISSTLGMEATMTVRTERVDATDFSLRTTAIIFTAAVLVHGSDHVRRGLDASPTAVMFAGSIQAVVVLIAVVLVFRRTRWAPYAAMVTGFGSAALFVYAHVLPTYAHVLPGFWTLSDSFVSEPHTHVNWFSWVTAVLEIITGIVFGVVGGRALRVAE